jgi:folate-binding protein YgfZ
MKLNDDYKFIAINEDFLSQTFSETDLNLSIQNHKNFLRIHYLQKKFHLLLLEMNTNYFKNLEVSDDLSEWERDNIINKDFNIEAKDSNKYTPHELGYHQTNRIDFEKGCYTGQEIVARMHYRAKKLPFLIIGSLDTKESVSTEVFNEEDKKVGSILSKAKQANSNLFLLSMNKNYDNEEIKFKDSSFISLK